MLILSYFWFGFVDSVFGISKVEMGFVDCGGRPVKKQRKMKRKKKRKTKKKDALKEYTLLDYQLYNSLVFYTTPTQLSMTISP